MYNDKSNCKNACFLFHILSCILRKLHSKAPKAPNIRGLNIKITKNNVLRNFVISNRQCTESYRHSQTFGPMAYCFGIDIRLLFLVSIARTTGMNMSVERYAIPQLSTLMFVPVVLAILTRIKRRMSIPKQYAIGC